MQQAALNFSRGVLDTRVPAQRASRTSRAAAEHLTASGVQGAKMARLLTAYAAVGVSGLAMFEVEQRAGLRPSSICSLRFGAVEQGWLLPLAASRVCPETERQQDTHRITTAGLQALAAWKEGR